jgi:hypothetical protein
MTTMIQRIARAMFECAEGHATWENASTEDREMATNLAYAVLNEMREPTEAMCYASRDRISTRATFSAMIDEALEEKQP